MPKKKFYPPNDTGTKKRRFRCLLFQRPKAYVKREYEIATELGKLMRAIDPDMRQGIVFKVIYYRYYNFDLDQPFQPQYEQNNRHLLADLHRIAREQ